MENASKALIMVASVMLGIILISFTILIFGIFKNFSIKNAESLEYKENSNFNSQFFKYYESEQNKIILTSHDLISIVNFVKENNLKYDLNDFSQNSYYVKIDVITSER